MDFKEFHLRSARILCVLFTTFCYLVSSDPLPAQEPSGAGQPKTQSIPITVPDAKAADRYATEPAVIERSDRESVFAADGTGVENQSIVIRVQTDAAAKDFGVVSFSYASASQRVDIDYLRVRHPDGIVVETPVAEALDMPSEIMRQAPFYSDIKQKQLPVRGLRAGDKLEWSIHIVRTKAEAPGRFWGVASFTGKERVALAESFTLRLPKAVPANVWSPKQSAKITEEGSDRVYRWISRQLEPTVGPEAQTRTEKEKKRVLSVDEVIDQTDGALPAIAWTNFLDWASVGDWYHSLETGRITPDDAIKAKASELIAGKTSDEDKIKALYTYVSTQIRYIGVALGQGRYQPHLASEVLSNQYGDCKDKATLLASLLAATGYSADTVLIGAGIRFNQDVPSPNAFNHAITAISIGLGSAKKTIWLDSTQEAAPYQALVFVIRDKNALRVPQTSSAYLDRTPADLPFPSFQRFDAKSTLAAEGVSTGRITITARGDDEIALRGAARQFSPAQYDQFVQYLIANLGYAGKATNSTISSPDNSDKPLEISFDYERDKPGDWSNYRISPQFPPDELPTVDEKEPPQTPILLGVPRTLTSRSEFKLPQGWGATLPNAIHSESPWVRYDKIYSLDKGTVSSERTIVILQARVPAARWADYKKFTDDISVGQDQWIDLTRPSSSATETPGPPPPTKDDPKAKALVDQAAEANKQRQIDRAGELLDEAKAINDEQPYLWSVMGYRAMLRGEMTEAVIDYRKELALHPNEDNVYRLLSTAQIAQGKRTDGEDTLRKRLKVMGPDAGASMDLTRLLLDDGNPKEALAVAETASKADPLNQRLRWMLGRARIKAGEKAAGTSTLLTAMREADEPGLRNDAAYELADNGQALPEVEEVARKIVDQLTTESAAWTLTSADQDITEMRKKSALLVSSWDTLGWVIYKSETGKEPARLHEAELYIAASWHSGLRAEVGLHLGELQEAAHHSAEALATYQMARAATPQSDSLGVRQPPNLQQRELDGRIARLTKLLPKAALDDPAHSLKDQLKLDVGPYSGESLVLPYRLLLSADGIQTPIPLQSIDGDHGKPDPVRDSKRIAKAIPKSWIPSGSSARLVRSVVLNCHQKSCDLAVAPLQFTR
jgi:tetratricopeptide (TPR) repeat protein